MSHIRNSPVGRAVGESMPFVLPVVILAAGKALYEALPLQYFAGVLAVVGLVLFLRRAPAAEPKVTEDDLSSKSRRAQSIAQELEREAASEHAARERKKVRHLSRAGLKQDGRTGGGALMMHTHLNEPSSSLSRPLSLSIPLLP